MLSRVVARELPDSLNGIRFPASFPDGQEFLGRQDGNTRCRETVRIARDQVVNIFTGSRMELHGIFEIIHRSVHGLVDQPRIERDRCEQVTQCSQRFVRFHPSSSFPDDVIHVVKADGGDKRVDLIMFGQ